MIKKILLICVFLSACKDVKMPTWWNKPASSVFEKSRGPRVDTVLLYTRFVRDSVTGLNKGVWDGVWYIGDEKCIWGVALDKQKRPLTGRNITLNVNNPIGTIVLAITGTGLCTDTTVDPQLVPVQ